MFASNKIKLNLQSHIIFVSCKKLMKEETSQIQLNSTNSHMKMLKEVSKSFTFDPIEQMSIKVDNINSDDQAELRKLIGGYLQYPSTQLAEIHSEAMRIGNYDLETKEETKKKAGQKTQEKQTGETNRKLCPCCGFVRQEDNIKVCTSMDDIKNIGMSTQLYFLTFKYLSILLAILLIYAIYAIISSGVVAKGKTNIPDYIKISLAAKQLEDNQTNRTLYYAQCWIGLFIMVIWILMIFGLKYKEMKELMEYDVDTSSCSDYSVVMEGIPLDVTKEELQAELNGYYNAVLQHRKIPEKKRKPFKIAKLNVAKPFYLNENQISEKEIKQIDKEISEIRDKFIEWVLERRDRSTFSVPKQQRNKIYEQYEKICKRRAELMKAELEKIKKQLKDEKSAQLTTAFVTFETNIARDLMVELNEVYFYSRIKSFFGDKNKFVLTRGEKIYSLHIDIAPEPEDIKWDNIGLRDCSIYLRKLFTYTFTLALLGGSFGIVYALSKKQNELIQNDPNQTDNNTRYLSIIISLVIAVTNVAIGQVIKFLTLFERDYTNTNNQASLAVKSIFAQMINSILIPVVVARYIKKDIYGASGLVDNIFMMSFTNALVGPLVVFFDPVNLLQKVKKCWRSRISSKITQNQREHNSVYEGIEFQVGYEYIYTGNLFMFVCFFVSLQPICVFAALLGYFLMYWVQKYCMFYRYRRPVPGSDFVNQAVWQIIMMGPILYSLGSLTWSNFLPEGFPQNAIVPNIIALVLSAMLFFVPLKPILLGCFFDDQTAKPTNYQDLRITFSSEYDRVNPSTQEEGMKEFQEFSQKYAENFKKMSAEQQRQIARKKTINNRNGQLNFYNQASHQAPNLGFLRGPGSQSLFASFIQQPPPPINPYQIMPTVFQHQAPQVNQQPIAIRQNQAPPPQPNPMASMFGGGMNGGMGGMGPMGGMVPMGGMAPMGMAMGGMVPMGGMGYASPGMNYMNPLGQMGFMGGYW